MDSASDVCYAVEDMEPCNLSCLMSCLLSNSPFPRRPWMISLYGVVCMSRVITFRRGVRGTYNLEELAFSFVFPSVTPEGFCYCLVNCPWYQLLASVYSTKITVVSSNYVQ